MKKSLFVLGVAALALASCTNEEVTEIAPSRGISFAGSGINNMTKAGDVTTDNFDEFQVFGGYADVESLFGTATEGLTVSKASGSWSYSPVQYWQPSETFNFGAYAPKADGISASWDYTNGLTLTVNSDAGHQNDVVYADATRTTTDDISNETAVPLTFKHLLSKIQFKFEKDAATLGSQVVTMQNFKVNGINTTCTWTKGTPNGTPATPGEYGDFTTAETVDATDGLPTDAYYVIPQTVGTFNIMADVVVTDGSNTIKQGTITATVPTTTVSAWTAQYAYLYTATLTIDNIDDGDDDPSNDPKPIVFDVEEFSQGNGNIWQDGTGSTVNIPNA